MMVPMLVLASSEDAQARQRQRQDDNLLHDKPPLEKTVPAQK
jgi:hypothetical protein